jgi:hypothetical protein
MLMIINKSKAREKGMPKWIMGSWTNTFQSNSNLIESLEFDTHNVCITKGLGDATPNCIYDQYKKYVRRYYSRKNVFRIIFLQGKNKIVYEFKLVDGICGKSKAMSYAITINGKKQKLHSGDCSMCFMKK